MPAHAVSTADLPDDIDALKDLVVAQAAREHEYETELQRLREQLNLLLAKRYGPSSEKLSPDQLSLFNEAELDTDTPPEREPAATVPVAAHERKRGGRKPLPDTLPRVRIEHDLPAGEKRCPCGCDLTRIGEETSEQLDIVPAQVRVLQHVRFKYACKACEETIKTAPLPAQPLPKSNASPGLLAHIVVAKYQDALPLARQEKILQRIGVDIPRATLAAWMIKLATFLAPMISQLRECLLAYDIVQMDETRIQVLKEPGRSAASDSYIWVQRGGPPYQPIVLFHYDPSRGQAPAKALLDGFAGFVQTDGYEVYTALAATRADIRLIGCFAHARRKFDEALKGQGKKGKTGKAQMGIAFIQRLYLVEKQLKDTDPEERTRERRRRAGPILEELYAWLERSLPEVPPSTLTGKALAYLHNQWPKLIGYLDDGRLTIDNNACERVIRPFVIGRRNWLFADTPNGAGASATLYSIIETAKANGHEPYRYLRHVLTELPKASSPEQVAQLLPFNISPEEIPDP
jgi:transposase